MAMVRVDTAALAGIAGQLRVLPDQLATARHELTAARGTTHQIGQAAATANSDELIRQLIWFADMAATTTAALTRGLFAAADDYAQAERIVVRFEGA